MRKVVFDRHETRLSQTQFTHKVQGFVTITAETAVAVEDRIQRAVRRIPVTLGIMPARITAQRDFAIWKSDNIYLLGANPCTPEKKRVKLPAVSKPRSKAMS